MYASTECANIYDVIEFMDTNMQAAGWTRLDIDHVTVDGASRTSYCVWQGIGDGNDKIYLQCRIKEGSKTDMHLDSMAGFDIHLEYFEQPGSIQQTMKADGEADVLQPMFTVTEDQRFYFWIYIDNYRVVGVARMSIVYESFYMGFITPIASERQYPYPMYVAGNGVATQGSWPDNETGSFIFPKDTSGGLRRADGTWRIFDADVATPDPNAEGTVFPYTSHNEKLVPNYKSGDTEEQDNFLLIPVMLQTNNPIDVNGILRDVFWLSGTRDIASEQILVYDSEQYMVFDVKQLRGSNTYFCIKMV